MSYSKTQAELARIIRKCIRLSGLKQYVVAERAGIKQNQLSDMLNGRKEIKSIHIPGLANVLGVTPNQLFGFDSIERGDIRNGKESQAV